MIANDGSDVVLFNARIEDDFIYAEMAFADVGTQSTVFVRFDGGRYKIKMPDDLVNKFSSSLAFDFKAYIIKKL